MRFVPKKRVALDGRVWWCPYDSKLKDWAHYYKLNGKYESRFDCVLAIMYAINFYREYYKDSPISLNEICGEVKHEI